MTTRRLIMGIATAIDFGGLCFFRFFVFFVFVLYQGFLYLIWAWFSSVFWHITITTTRRLLVSSSLSPLTSTSHDCRAMIMEVWIGWLSSVRRCLWCRSRFARRSIAKN